jgi:hypothetical protein
MRISWISGERDFPYPVIRCARCYVFYHLPQGVRSDELQRAEGQARAISAGWTVPDEGPPFCPSCTKHSPKEGPK